jgi:hypothetical protein
MPGADNEATLERLDRLESRGAIADLIFAYARAMRANRAENTRSLFAPESYFEIRDGHPDKQEFAVRERIEGRENVVGHLSQVKGGPHPIPLIHNLTVEVSGDTATSNCVMEAQFYGSELRVFGEYHDTFRRIDGRWLFTSRTYTIFSGASSV